MAAWPEQLVTELVDLQRLPPGSLDALLDEESTTWRQQLCWDFSSSATLVKRFFDMQSLGGMALVYGQRIVGYTYTVVEEEKGLVGDLYVLREFANAALEEKLLTGTVESLAGVPGVRRIESQVILLSKPCAGPSSLEGHLQEYERCFMMCPLADRAQTHLIAKAELEVEPWSERYLEDAAVLIADSYAGHVDGKINDQYRSLTGARRFLQNIVQYPGCGSFQAGASRLAWRKSTGRLCGLALASLVAGDTGHITQICVSPNSRGEGIGRALLTCSMEALRSMHCRNVSLTVTASNRNAIALYESLGFYTRRRFSAMVWDNLRAPRKYFR